MPACSPAFGLLVGRGAPAWELPPALNRCLPGQAKGIIFPDVNRDELITYLERLDAALSSPAMLYVYGSAPCILLGEPDRASLDIDVAAPYSEAHYGDLAQAAKKAGIPINPGENAPSSHIEWIQALRLCLPRPDPEKSVLLWQGERLTIKSAPVPELIASKLIRYDGIDQGDIQYLCSQSPVSFSEIEAAVQRLPPPFNKDVLVLENLESIRTDLQAWRGGSP